MPADISEESEVIAGKPRILKAAALISSPAIGFLALWLTMLFPSETPLFLWICVGAFSMGMAFYPVIRVSRDLRLFHSGAAWISLLAAVTAFAAIEQMLHYPIIRGIEDVVPIWESRAWARAGSILGLPVAILSLQHLGDNDSRNITLTLASIAWSLITGVVTMGLLVVLRHVLVMRRPLLNREGKTGQ